MRSIIDAHVHIRPSHLCGTTDALCGVRLESYGKIVFPDGGEYQYMPPYFADSCFSADTLIRTLDVYGVERAVILQSPAFCVTSDVMAAVAKYPQRLLGAVTADLGSESALDDLTRWCKKGLTVMKFEMSETLGYSHPNAYPGLKFDSPRMNELFDHAQMLGMTVTVDTGPPFSNGYQVEELEHAISSHPALRFVICHLGFPGPKLTADAQKLTRWREMTALARYGNVWFDVAAIPDLFLSEGYPFGSALTLLEEFVGKWGNEKAIWGSDIPGTLNSATYPQMMQMFEACKFPGEDGPDRLFGLNALDAYW